MIAPTLVGVSLKMYFGHARTLDWIGQIGALARARASIIGGSVELFVIPGYLSIAAACANLAGTGVRVGAQDLATADSGAFTGEVSGVELAELGVTLVEVGHAERRTLFGETDDIVAAKTEAALRNGLVPLICIGETVRTTLENAASACLRQLESAIAMASPGRVIVAYEPVWAIGADAPAEPAYVREVCIRLRAALDTRPGSSVIYGGSAGPGLLTELGADIDGVFLGRSAHDPAALDRVLDEATLRSGGDVFRCE